MHLRTAHVERGLVQGDDDVNADRFAQLSKVLGVCFVCSSVHAD